MTTGVDTASLQVWARRVQWRGHDESTAVDTASPQVLAQFLKFSCRHGGSTGVDTASPQVWTQRVHWRGHDESTGVDAMSPQVCGQCWSTRAIPQGARSVSLRRRYHELPGPGRAALQSNTSICRAQPHRCLVWHICEVHLSALFRQQ